MSDEFIPSHLSAVKIIASSIIKRESTRRSSNKWTKILYRDYWHHIANFCVTALNIFSKEIIPSNTKGRKQILKFAWNTWKYWWNETGDEKLSVFAHFTELWCYFRQLFISLVVRKCKKACYTLKIILLQSFVHLKLKLLDFLSDFVLIAQTSFLQLFSIFAELSFLNRLHCNSSKPI